MLTSRFSSVSAEDHSIEEPTLCFFGGENPPSLLAAIAAAAFSLVGGGSSSRICCWKLNCGEGGFSIGYLHG